MKNFKLIMLLIGSVVGAGFASGREITALFTYPISIFVAPITGVGIFCCSSMFLLASSKVRPPSINELNKQIMKKTHILADVFLLFNSLIVLAGMLSAVDSLLDTIVPLSPAYSLICGILSAMLICKGIKGLAKGNLIFVPLIGAIIILISSLSISLPIKLQPLAPSNIPSIIIYISMNMMLASTVYTSIYPLKKRQILFCCAICAAVITILLSLLILALNSTQIQAPLPIIRLAQNQGKPMLYLSVVCVLCAIFCTMATAMSALNSWLSSLIGKGFYSTAIVLISGLIVSNLGFENIVKYLYPVIGIFGALYIALSLVFVVKIKAKSRHKGKIILSKPLKSFFNHGNTKIHQNRKHT